MRWHDSSTDEVPVYLGYPLHCGRRQLIRYFDTLLDKMKSHTLILSQRHLSIRGRSLVINAILLSRIWHCVRVISPYAGWIPKLTTVVRKFAMPFLPAPAMKVLLQPKGNGGLSLLDVNTSWMSTLKCRASNNLCSQD
jgi:hypothetical protein